MMTLGLQQTRTRNGRGMQSNWFGKLLERNCWRMSVLASLERRRGFESGTDFESKEQLRKRNQYRGSIRAESTEMSEAVPEVCSLLLIFYQTDIPQT